MDPTDVQVQEPDAAVGLPARLARSRASLTHGAWALLPQVLAELAHGVRSATVDDVKVLRCLVEDGADAAGIALEGEGGAPLAAVGGRRQVSGSVAVIPVKGVLKPRLTLFDLFFGGGVTVERLRGWLREAAASEQVGAIVLDVDSPGGAVDGIPELAAEIRTLKSSKPIVAVANTMAASAAYWLASQASEVFVTRSGAVGSIGVYTAHEDWSKFDEQLGVATTLISAGRFKTEGNPYEPLSDEARDAMQATVDTYYGMFVDAVARGRGVKAADVRGGFGEGRMVLADAAVREGMADQVGGLEDAIVRAARLASGGSRSTRATDDTPPAVADTSAPTPAAATETPAPDPIADDVAAGVPEQLLELVATSPAARAAFAAAVPSDRG